MRRLLVRHLPSVIWISALILQGCSEGEFLLLDRQALLEHQDWWDDRDWDWYKTNIPFFESPDPELDATYYYRWELLTKHLTYGSPETGYTFTEFIDRPFWSGRYGAISCPLGHQAYEIRWLKNRRIVEDFARYWFETPGAEPRSYSNWYGDAMWATYAVLGDTTFLRRVYPHMEAQVAGWTQERWDPEHRMYRWVGAWDGMETNINSRLTDDGFSGAEGYRPTLNSYLFADFRALSRTAALFGDLEKARDYADRADALKARVQEELWDPDREFFFHQFAFDERAGIEAKSLTYETGPFAGDPHGRELLGYVPWQFHLPDPGYEVAWKFLTDPGFFFAPFGPTGVEQGDPQFFVSPRCCVWSGNAWPYATAQTLTAMANLLHDYDQDVVDRADYFTLFRTYALSHRQGGRPYLAEAADPFTGSWEGHNTFYHSEHYLHSGFLDQLISGLVGLRPRTDDTLRVDPLVPQAWDFFALEGVAYHGRELSILWDRDGSRYGRGAGLAAFLDGRELARREGLGEIRVAIPPPLASEPQPRMHNFAANNDGEHFPLATVSSSNPLHPPFYAVDGNRWYHPSPPNRWVSEEGDSLPWFELDFGVERPMTKVQLYFLDDPAGPPTEAVGEETDGGFPLAEASGGAPPRPPESFTLEFWEVDEWRTVPGQRRALAEPMGRRANTVSFPELLTTRIRVVLQPRLGAAVGLTEFEAWGSSELPAAVATAPVTNLALRRGEEDFPRISASFTYQGDSPEEAVDGRFPFTGYSRNRWTAFGTPNGEDWLEVDFGGEREVARIDLFLFGDGQGVAAPEDYRIETWSGAGWESVLVRARSPDRPMAWALNRVELEPVLTERLRVLFRHALPQVSGIAELRIWDR